MEIPDTTFETDWVLKAIAHELRQKILRLIANNTYQSYTDLMQKLSLSTGKLNFHLKQLTGLIEKREDGSYILSTVGKNAFDILEQINSIGEDKKKMEYLKKIALTRSLRQIEPAPEIKKKWFIWIFIIYGFFIWLPMVILISATNFDLLNSIASYKEIARIFINIGIFSGIILICCILTCLTAVFYYKSISYEIMDTEIVIIKGVIVKTKAVIPFRTITNLVIKQGPFDLLFGISIVIIQTAGESAKGEPEGKLVGIYYAHDLIEEILNLVRLLDPPNYLKERIPSSASSKNLTALYSQILAELQKIDSKLTE
ncbi:MAG: winged helix-turn-helix transcriptional regulator [Candidatus Heimdallarchaeota archaeon]|nr:winged helix-turn-helix transcriptional regulator [Candidatus Heimdallarchaeota archaeon]